jgi:hypothetical protein
LSVKQSEHIERAVRLLCEPNEVYELRCPKANQWGHTFSGYFNDLAKLAAAAKELSGSVPAVYVTSTPSTLPCWRVPPTGSTAGNASTAEVAGT